MAKTKYACEILGQTYPTATALRARCREIIDKYLRPGCGLEQEIVGDDFTFFVELVRLRDASRIPAGTYVRRVVRCCRDGQVGRHVRFEYGDGTCDMIGWSKLCGGRQATFTQVSNAMRDAVADQSRAVYSAFFAGRSSGVCPMSGETISYTGEFYGDSAAVHHDGLTFAEIRDMWFASSGTTSDDVPLQDMFDGGGYSMARGALRDSWVEFHKQHARLVVVSSSWHHSHHSSGGKGIREGK